MADILVGKLDSLNTQKPLVVDIDDEVALLQSDKTPLLVLTQAINGKRVVENPEFKWLEDEYLPYETDFNANHLDTDTVLSVVDAKVFIKNDIVYNVNTKETMLVVDVDYANNTITVQRGYGSTAQAITSGDIARKIGNAYEEFSGAELDNTTKVVEKSNYTQIIKTRYGISRTAQNSKAYGGEELSYLRKKKMVEHAIKLEQAYWFSRKNLDTSGSHPKRTFAGILQQIETDGVIGNFAFSESSFEDWLRDVFRYGASKRVLFASPKLLGNINALAKNKLQMNSKEQVYGITIWTYVCSYGEVKLVNARETLRGTGAPDGVILELDKIRKVVLKGGETKLKANVQAPDVDGVEDIIIGEYSVEVKVPKVHGILYLA